MTTVPILAVVSVVVIRVLACCFVVWALALCAYWTATDVRQERERQVPRLSRSTQRMSTTRRRRLPGWMVPNAAQVTTRRERRLLRLYQRSVQFCEQLLAENKRLRAENANLCVERNATDALLGEAMDVLKREQPGDQA
jgi:hypothetical protein